MNRMLKQKRPGLKWVDWLFESTLTYKVHNAPGDYWRFSEQAVEEVLLEGMRDIRLHVTMVPPRIIGSAIKP